MPTTAKDVQIAIASDIGWWKHLIVPNIYLGAATYEMDLAVLTKAQLLWEVEIKISKSDWRADNGKKKWEEWRRSAIKDEVRPSRFYYAVPVDLCPDRAIPDFVRPEAGVLLILPGKTSAARSRVVMVRQSAALHRNKLAGKYIAEMYSKIHRRYWSHVAPVDKTLGVKE